MDALAYRIDVMLKDIKHPLLVAVITTFLLAIVSQINLFIAAEAIIENVWYRISPKELYDKRIIVIEIDDETLEHYGQTSLGRDQFALLLTELVGTQSRANTIVIDVCFEGPDINGVSNDTLLSGVIFDYRDQVVNSVYFSLTEGDYIDQPLSMYDQQCLESFGYDIPGLRPPNTTDSHLPLDLFLCNSKLIGHLGVKTGVTTTPRTIPLFINFKGVTIGAISVEAVRNFLGLKRNDLRYLNNKLEIGPFNIPIDKSGNANIKYFRSVINYERYTLLNILKEYKERKLSRNYLSNKIVLIGYNSPRYFPDEYSIDPYGDKIANLYLQAHIIKGMLNGSFLSNVSLVTTFVLLGIASILYALLILIRGKKIRLLLGFVGIIIILAIDLTLFEFDYLLNSTPIIVASLLLMAYNEIMTVRSKRKISEVTTKSL